MQSRFNTWLRELKGKMWGNKTLINKSIINGVVQIRENRKHREAMYIWKEIKI